MTFSEQDFFEQQLDRDRLWGRVIWIAIGLHILVFVATWKAPAFFNRKPLLEEVMTIDLVSMPEPANPSSAVKPELVPPKPAARAPEPPPAQEKPPEQEVVSVAPEPEIRPEPAPAAQPISIRPLKKKVRKAKDLRLDEEKKRERLARQEKAKREQELIRKKIEQARRKKARREALARAQAEERRAREAARQARAELAAALQVEKELHSPRTGSGRRGSGRSSGVSSALEKQYYMDLAGRVQRLWVLPAIKKWPPSLETIIEFTVLGNGNLVGVKVARSSGDSFFDRFALETVKKASPAPPIPLAIHKKRLDLGFRLRPAGVQ